MRLLFIINIDMSQSGPSVHLLNDIIAEAKMKGHSVTRIEKKYGNNTWKLEHEFKDDEEIFRFECGFPKSFNYAKRYLNDVKYASKCKKIAKGKSFDCVFVQSCNTAAFQLSWIRNTGCLCVYNVQDIFPLDIHYEGVLRKNNPIYIVMDILQRYAYKKSDCIITISEDMKRTLEELGVPSNKILVVHNWAFQADYDLDLEMEVFKKYYDNKKFNVVYAGNIGIAQSVETLIKAARLLKDKKNIQVLIFGSGSRKKKCEQLIEELQSDNVSLFELLPQKYSQYVYHLADINIVTLIHGIMKTSLPSKTASCYNSGKPVVYCIEKDSRTLKTMQKENDLIYQCDPEDPEKLARIILAIYEKIGVEHIQYRSVKRYEDVMLPQSAKEYVNIFEQLFAKKEGIE